MCRLHSTNLSASHVSSSLFQEEKNQMVQSYRAIGTAVLKISLSNLTGMDWSVFPEAWRDQWSNVCIVQVRQNDMKYGSDTVILSSPTVKSIYDASSYRSKGLFKRIFISDTKRNERDKLYGIAVFASCWYRSVRQFNSTRWQSETESMCRRNDCPTPFVMKVDTWQDCVKVFDVDLKHFCIHVMITRMRLYAAWLRGCRRICGTSLALMILVNICFVLRLYLILSRRRSSYKMA